MSVLIVVAVRDSAVNAFMRPFFVQAVGAAVRSFGDEVQRQGDYASAPMYHHPADYELFELGTFDEGRGIFALLPEARSIARGLDFSEVRDGRSASTG